MKRRTCVVLLAGLLVVAIGSRASGAGAWTAPVAGCAVLTPFAAVYDGMTHRGVDLAAEPGSAVAAPVAGTVCFAGRVPADGGGTCGAVTVELPDGLKVTMLPLAEVWVGAGDAVTAGEAVGAVAASGDSSAGASHLHVGLRRGEVYLDPTGLLPVAAPVAPVSEGPISLPEGSGESDPPTPREAPDPAGSAPMLAPSAAVPAGLRSAAPPASASIPAEAVRPGQSVVSRMQTAPVRHPVPRGAGVPAASQIVQVGPVQAGIARWSSAIAPALGAHPTPLALVAPGIAFVLVGALGLGRQFAHGRAS